MGEETKDRVAKVAVWSSMLVFEALIWGAIALGLYRVGLPVYFAVLIWVGLFFFVLIRRLGRSLAEFMERYNVTAVSYGAALERLAEQVNALKEGREAIHLCSICGER